MTTTITKETRRQLVLAVGERYRGANREDKERILTEFVATTGYHRKHAIRILNDARARLPESTPPIRLRLYDEAAREALVTIWEASDRVCGKRLKALLPTLVAALERHGHMQLDDAVRRSLMVMSAATIDRALAGQRSARRRPRTKPSVRSAIPVRTFADWKDPLPGFLEIDLVAHGGPSAAGSFVHTLTMTDISSGWTECLPLLVREASLVVEGLEGMRLAMPFALRGIDSDNGSEFVNEALVKYCKEHDVEFTRSRPHRKNDQAWVEQKNGAVVRRMVGYGRLEGIAGVEALARLFSASRLFVNFFQPSFKLAEKTRVGARVSKRYHPPETPAARLLTSTAISDAMKDRLRATLLTLDPLRLLDEIRMVQEHIAALAAGEVTRMLPRRDADLERFLKSLALAWKEGEVRPTHRRASKSPRHWRTREDPFADLWGRLLVWLNAEPHRTSRELLDRLEVECPGEVSSGQLRTLQRRVKEWRRGEARRLVFGHGPGCEPGEAAR